MYHLINKNIVKVLNSIDRDSDINTYLKIMEIFNEGFISNNEIFKSVYRKYYQLNAARLSENYCSHYFKVMDDFRYKENISIKVVVEELYKVPTNAKDKNIIMFSFATKLLHTIDNTRPLYDSFVGDFYFFPQIKINWSYDKKLSTYLQGYGFLQQESKRILDNQLLSESIEKFRKRFELPQVYTDQKIIDTLLWRFAAYLRSGSIIAGEIKYS